MRRRSAISGPGGGGALSRLSSSRARVSSSMTWLPSVSISSARAAGVAAPKRVDATATAASTVRRMLLLGRGRRRLGGPRVLVRDQRLTEVDRRAIFGIGGDRVALLEADDLEVHLLAL